MSARDRTIIAVAIATLVAARAAAVTPAGRCAAAKELVAGRLVRELARCGDPANPDAVCRGRATGHFADKWARAEARGGCAATGDSTAIGTAVDVFLGDLGARLAVAGAPSRCTTAKFTKAASVVLCVLKCEARAARRGGAVDARCSAACATGFVAACGAAERANDCRTTTDCGPLGGRAQRFGVDVAAALAEAAGLPCPHDVCERGTPMGVPPCNDRCVATICGVDPYCCSTTWDATCVAEVASTCGLATCPVCGDGFVDFPEVCDPTSTLRACPAGQTCSGDCASCETVCGDGVVGPGETCDPPGATTGCPAGHRCGFTCATCEASCGDGLVSPEETCDPGAPASCPRGQRCLADCSACATACGDGEVGPGEVCDPPGARGGCPAGDVCAPGCRACTTCGNGVADPGEVCDPTLDLPRAPCRSGTCRADCTGCGVCGDGTIDPGEVCDPAAVPSGCPAGERCEPGCHRCTTVCGDGMIGPGEVCDPPRMPGGCPAGVCAFDCRSCTTCGNGELDAGEACDPPGATTGCPAGKYCRFDCGGCDARCGDGILGPGEVCDPPGLRSTCPEGSVCAPGCGRCATVCGDGMVGPGELCDPPGSPGRCPTGETCSADCGSCVELCGDGALGPDELCDPPFSGASCAVGTSCSPSCNSCVEQCGDGIVGPGEVCDPPGSTTGCPNGVPCRFDCRQCGFCGDDIVSAGEACDPPLSPCANGLLCSGDCSSCGFCGDGVVGLGELCDPPGSTDACAAGQFCSSDCTRCGPLPRITRVSVTDAGTEAVGLSRSCAISHDGRYVAFDVDADLVPSDVNGTADVYVRDVFTNRLELVSVTPSGTSGNSYSLAPGISGDGRWVAFVTAASDIVPDAAPSAVVLRDRCVSFGVVVPGCTPATEVVSLTHDGGRPAGGTGFGTPAVSADGRFVAFASDHTSLVADDTVACLDYGPQPGSCPDVFMRDRCIANGTAVAGCVATTEMVSVATDGTHENRAADGYSAPAIGADGGTIAFDSSATNLATPIPETDGNVYVRDLRHGTTELASIHADGTASSLPSYGRVSISDDGRFVAFGTLDAFLLSPPELPLDLGAVVVVHDRATGANELISRASDGTPAEGFVPSISRDGRRIAFVSFADDLAPGASGLFGNVFVHDRVTGATARVSVAFDGSEANGDTLDVAISGDGGSVCMVSEATNLLLPGADLNESPDVFLIRLDPEGP